MDTRALYWAGRYVGRAGANQVRVASIGGLAKLVVDLSDDDGRMIYVVGCYEPDVTAFAMAVLRHGDIALDVGANIGAHAVLFAALVASTGHVHAFEPNPVPAGYLRASVSCNGWDGRITIHDFALAKCSGEASLALGGEGGATSSLMDLPWLEQSERISIATTTLDSFSSVHLLRAPRLLKVDVEGAEELVLAGGATRFFPSTPPDYLALEFWSYRRPDALWEVVRGLGYTPVGVRHGSVVPVPFDPPRHEAAALHDSGFQYKNLFFQNTRLAEPPRR